jgi:haloalkane dehalogenase
MADEEASMAGSVPYGKLKYKDVKGSRMAYVDEGQGDAIVFAHGNPTSSYLWRNVMPHLEGMGRLVAADMIGMGGSAKLNNSGPDRYNYAEQRDYLFGLWDSLDLGNKVVLVLHDWGSAVGFDWARQHPDRVQGIAFMESIVADTTPADFPAEFGQTLAKLRGPDGEQLVLDQNVFVEGVLPQLTMRQLSDEEMGYYRKPYERPGEDRRPMLQWVRAVPLAGEPADVTAIVGEYGQWLATSEIPKLFINAEPGTLMNDRLRQLVRSWPNVTEHGVTGTHFIQEDIPDEIGETTARFVEVLRSA